MLLKSIPTEKSLQLGRSRGHNGPSDKETLGIKIKIYKLWFLSFFETIFWDFDHVLASEFFMDHKLWPMRPSSENSWFRKKTYVVIWAGFFFFVAKMNFTMHVNVRSLWSPFEHIKLESGVVTLTIFQNDNTVIRAGSTPR